LQLESSEKNRELAELEQLLVSRQLNLETAELELARQQELQQSKVEKFDAMVAEREKQLQVQEDAHNSRLAELEAKELDIADRYNTSIVLREQELEKRKDELCHLEKNVELKVIRQIFPSIEYVFSSPKLRSCVKDWMRNTTLVRKNSNF
jgi:hypothetical protein